MRVAFGADDEAEVVDFVVEELKRRGNDVAMAGRGQWPDVALEVAERVSAGDADCGVLFCWTGTGTSMVANKVPGIRAALAWNPWIAEGARRWNDANLLVMSLKATDVDTARAILDAWFRIEAPDADESANIEKIAAIEKRYQRAPG